MRVSRLAPLLFLLLPALPLRGQAPPPPAALSREDCAACHEKEADAFAKGPHGRAMASRDPKLLDRSCVACHRPEASHVEDPQSGNVRRTPPATACASCHAGNLASGSGMAAHERNGVACLSCHVSGHAAPPAPPLLARPAADLCASCHPVQAAAGKLPSAHRDGSRAFDCRSCHSVHGTGTAGRLTLQGKGAVCVDCHTEKAGPFVFPHPPRDVEGCVSCHQPHGSTNPRMLKRRAVRDLCLECHTGLPSVHDLTKPRYANCQSCHVAVHGSDRDARLFDE